ncbi:MAG: FAD-dependent oxidoreductase, partial [Thermodesulfobacteriota bacterium]
MSIKHSAYICTGCGIGDGLDIEALAKVVSGEKKMPVKTHPFLCSAEGRGMVQEDIDKEGVNSVVIGACSFRVKQDELSYGDGVMVSRANLREQVVWSAGPDPDKDRIQELASDNMRMACTRAAKCAIPEAQAQTLTKGILVIGGGIAGLTAAREAAKAGYEVTLVEKTGELGGFARTWRKQLPTKAPWTDLEAPMVDSLVAEVKAAGNITIKLNTEVARIAGAPGMFDISFKAAGSKSDWDAPPKVTKEMEDLIEKGQLEDPRKAVKHYMESNPEASKFGTVVLATGWRPADVSEFAHLGHGTLKNVVTNVELERMAKAGRLTRPSDGKPVTSVAFVQSPGAKEHDKDFPYANSVTSSVTLKQAKYLREENPDAKAYILYQHMRTPGNMELFYKAAQNDDGIFLTKAAVTGVSEAGDGSLTVAMEDTLLGASTSVDVDLVVLAAGMVPTTRDAACLNLAYRQGPALIDLDLFDGHADSHFICFPYETRRTGIYACGGVRKAMTVEETMDDATGAALKAIQCIESASRGVAVHPRAGDKTYLEFF